MAREKLEGTLEATCPRNFKGVYMYIPTSRTPTVDATQCPSSRMPAYNYTSCICMSAPQSLQLYSSSHSFTVVCLTTIPHTICVQLMPVIDEEDVKKHRPLMDAENAGVP